MMSMPMMKGAPMGDMVTVRALRAVVRLSDGQFLSLAMTLPSENAGPSWPFAVALLVMAMIVVPVSIWAVSRVTMPLHTLGAAAAKLGQDIAAPPIAETGSLELRQTTRAFNTMQARLRSLVENRTRMLAALSHDLRTPLTLLRLRTEAIPDPESRERMLGTIAGMNDMIEATLAFARDEAQTEAPRLTDVTALLAAVVDDMQDAGMDVRMEPERALVMSCRPMALRRVFGNLLDNAVKYGGAALRAPRELSQ